MSVAKAAYDIIISGAGPVGSLTALALSRSQYLNKILLIEKFKPNLQLSTIPNQRVYSINTSSLRILESLGVFPSIKRRGTINKIKVFSKDDSINF